MRCLAFFILASYIPHAWGQSPGIISDSVKCQSNVKQFYALYLPKDYDREKTFSLILFFDPGGHAKEPLKLYSAIADKYQIILACSYQSRNGPMQPSVEAGHAMLQDITKRFSVNSKMILVSGFSGGARLATFLAINESLFAGVIACGASFPSGNKILKEKKIPYALVVGDRDMNYEEMINSFGYLDQIQNPKTLIVFHGNHQWPPTESFEEAMTWHLLQNKMLEKSMAEKLYKLGLKNILLQMDSANYLNAYELAFKLSEAYKSACSTAKADSLLALISSNNNYLKEKKNREKILIQEQEWRNKFLSQYNRAMLTVHTDTAFHERDWTSFQKEFSRYRASKEKEKQLMGERLFGFSQLICAEQSGLLFKQEYFQQAFVNTQIWSAMAPDDFRPFIMLAKIKARQGLNKESIQYLKKAFQKGFKNKTILEMDKNFDSVRNDPGYKKLN